jgi:cyanate permease
MAVFTFLPLIFEQAGLSPQRAGFLTAIAALVNAVGNGFAATVLRFWSPSRLIAFSAFVMALSAWICFGGIASFASRYAAVLVFSAVGGFIPGTLFVLSSRLAASSQAGSTTVGLMQQGSAVGQAIGPPLVAVVAASAGAWHHTWMVTSALALGVLLAAFAIRSTLKKTS